MSISFLSPWSLTTVRTASKAMLQAKSPLKTYIIEHQWLKYFNLILHFMQKRCLTLTNRMPLFRANVALHPWQLTKQTFGFHQFVLPKKCKNQPIKSPWSLKGCNPVPRSLFLPTFWASHGVGKKGDPGNKVGKAAVWTFMAIKNEKEKTTTPTNQWCTNFVPTELLTIFNISSLLSTSTGTLIWSLRISSMSSMACL